jgi:hypothetical protein
LFLGEFNGGAHIPSKHKGITGGQTGTPETVLIQIQNIASPLEKKNVGQ